MVTIINPEKNNSRNSANNSFENEILRKVIKESWRGKLPDGQKSGISSEILEGHAVRMGRMMGTLDYEALCMPNVTVNARHMSAIELRDYVSLIERLAAGYQQHLGNNITDVILIGLTFKAKDIGSARRYYDLFVSDMEQRLASCVKISDKEAVSLRDLSTELHKRNSGPLRFLRKREIQLLNSAVVSKRKRISRLSRRIGKYSSITHRTKHA